MAGEDDMFLTRLAQIDGADMNPEAEENANPEADIDPTDLFLQRLAALGGGLDGAPPGCAPMRAVPLGEEAPPKPSSGPSPYPEPSEFPPEQPPAANETSAGGDDVDIETQIASSNWKDRKAAYEQLRKTFESNSGFEEYGPKLEQLCGEAQAMAFKDACKAMNAFCQKAPDNLVKQYIPTCLKETVQKLADTGAKNFLIQLWLTALEVMDFDPWFEMAKPIINEKKRKIPGVGAQIVCSALEQFGADVCDPQALLEWAIGLLKHTDADVKKFSKKVVVCCYQVYGETVEAALEDANVKKATMKQLKKDFKKVEGKPLEPTKYRRGEEPSPGGGDAGSAPAKAKPKPKKKKPALKLKGVDIFKDLEGDWEANAGDSSWKPKKKALDDLFELAEAKKAITAGPRFAAVSNLLPPLCGDSNVNVAGCALKVVALLAERMEPKDFKSCGKACLEHACPKWKEKKMAVKVNLDKLLLTLYQKVKIPFSDFVPYFKEAAKDRNATYRCNAAEFVKNVSMVKELQMKSIDDWDSDDFCEIMFKLCFGESNGQVRDAACLAYGHIAGSTQLGRYLNKLDPVKDKKKAIYKKIDAVLKEYENAAPPPAPEPEEESEPPPKPAAEPVEEEAAPVEKPKKKAKKPKLKDRKKKGKKGKKGGASRRKKASPHNEADLAASDKEPLVAKDNSEKYEGGPNLGASACEDAVSDLLGGSVEALQSKKWGEREEALTTLLEAINSRGGDISSSTVGVMRYFLSNKLKQSQIKASGFILRILTQVVIHDQDIKPKVALIPFDEDGMFTVLGEKKVDEQAQEYCMAVAEAIGPKILVPYMLRKMPSDSRSSKVRGSVWQVVANIVAEFGMSSTNYMYMIMKAQEALNNGPRGEEKDAIVKCLTYCYAQTGTFFRNTLMTSVNPRMIKVLQENFDPLEEEGGLGKFNPVKKVRGQDFAEPLSMDKLVPRKDISKLMNEAAGKLGDKNWKTRKEGLDELEEVLKGAGGRMKPSVPGSLWVNLRSMQKDTNKNLTVGANKVLVGIVEAGGPKFAKQTKEIIPAVLPTCADKKKPVANQAGAAVKAWINTCGFDCVAPHLHEGLNLPAARPVLIPLLNEIITELDEKGEKLDFEDVINPLLQCCLDKNATIKSQTKAFFPIIIKHATGQRVMNEIGSFKANDQANLQKGLKKVLGDLEPEAGSGKKKKGKEKKGKKAAKAKKGKKKKSKEKEETPPPPEPEVETGPLKVSMKGRKGRLKKKRRYKGSWVDTSTGEIKTMTKHFHIVANAELYEDMLGERSEFREWIKAMDLFLEMLKESPEPVLNNLDMIIQWSAWKMIEKNATNSDMKILNFWNDIISYFKENNLKLVKHEADQFLPCIVERSIGNMKKQVSELAKTVFENAESVYDVVEMSKYLWDTFVESKNNRAKAGALQQLDRLFNDYGLDIVNKKPGKKVLLQTLYKSMDKADNNVRKAGLAIFVTFAHALGKDKILKLTAKATPKTKDMISNRLQKTTWAEDFAPRKSDEYLADKPAKKKKEVAKPAAETAGGTPAAPESAATETAGETAAPAEAALAPVAAAPVQQQFTFSPQDLDTLPAAFEPVDWTKFSMSGNANTGNQTAASFDFNSMNFNQGANPTVQSMGGMNDFGMSGMNMNMGSMSMGGMGMGGLGSMPEMQVQAPPETLPDIISGLESHQANSLEALRKGFEASRWSDVSLKPHTERLISALVTWWQQILERAAGMNAEEKQKLSEHLVDCLFYISKEGGLLESLGIHSLENFIRIMLISLISPEIRSSFSNRKSLIARVNDITLNVLENCDRNMAFYILISFLKQAEPEETKTPIESSSNFSNVVVKCLAKLMILIPNVIQSMKIDQILHVIHQFFTLKPPNIWNRPGCNDKPYRIARTCLSKFVEFKGPEILQDLRKVVGENPNPKPVVQIFTEEFIAKKFPNYQLEAPATARLGSGNYGSMISSGSLMRTSLTSASAGSFPSSSTVGSPQDNVSAELMDIIASLKPADAGYSDPGLVRLHEFMQRNPHADLDQCLQGQSDVFKGFVKRGLKRIEELNAPPPSMNEPQTMRRMNRTPSNASMSSINSFNKGAMSTDDLRERLQELRKTSAVRTRKRDNSISIDSIRERLQKFQTGNTSAPTRDPSGSTATSAAGYPRGTSQTSFSGISGLANMAPSYSQPAPQQPQAPNKPEASEAAASKNTSLSDLRARLNRIKQQT